MTAFVVQPIDETSILFVPPLWGALPDDWRDGLGFWHVVRSVQLQQNVIPVGPPRDIDWTVSDDPDVFLRLRPKLRHPCGDCIAGIDELIETMKRTPGQVMAHVQFVQDYLLDARKIPTEFAPTRGGKA